MCFLVTYSVSAWLGWQDKMAIKDIKLMSINTVNTITNHLILSYNKGSSALRTGTTSSKVRLLSAFLLSS